MLLLDICFFAAVKLVGMSLFLVLAAGRSGADAREIAGFFGLPGFNPNALVRLNGLVYIQTANH